MTSTRLTTIKNILALPALLLATGALADSATHHYTVTVDYSMRWLWVEARFSRPVDSISARSRHAGKFLADVRGCGEELRALAAD